MRFAFHWFRSNTICCALSENGKAVLSLFIYSNAFSFARRNDDVCIIHQCLQFKRKHEHSLKLVKKHILLDSAGNKGGWDSSVGKATCDGLDGLGIESLWLRDFPQLSRPILGLTRLRVFFFSWK
jgi:hypothetical protein